MSYAKWHSLHASFFLSPTSRFLLLHSRCLMTNGIHFMLLSSSLLHLDPSIALKMSYDKWHSLHASFFLTPPSRSFYCTQDVL
ncbi:hypothetical protein P8452_65808 [Trifolium repens]|nr:hypothetical protein P8452_65808 [Trifolium repens]